MSIIFHKQTRDSASRSAGVIGIVGGARSDIELEGGEQGGVESASKDGCSGLFTGLVGEEGKRRAAALYLHC